MLDFVYFFDGDEDSNIHRVSLDISYQDHLIDSIQNYFLRILLESPFSSLHVFCSVYSWHINLQGCTSIYKTSFPGLPYIDDGGNIAFAQSSKGGLNE